MSGRLFSVVIPNFNRTCLLYRALNSVVSQSYRRLEVIVIDDGSDPAIQSSVKTYIDTLNDDRIKLVALDENIGGAAARNIGIRYAKGEYICFLDSDDEWDPRKIQFENTSLIENGEVDIIYSQLKNIVDDALVDIVPKVGIGNTQSIESYLFSTNKSGRGMQTSTICVRASLAKQILFREGLKGHQDWDFLLRIGEVKPVVRFLDKCLTNRFLQKKENHSDNVSLSLDYDFSKFFYEEYKRYLSLKSCCFFRTRILLKKSIAQKKQIIRNVFFLGNLLDLRFIFSEALKLFSQKRSRKIYDK